jgi:hypothetical protein
MKTRRSSFAPVVLSFLVAMLGLLGGGTPALAASPIPIAIAGTVNGSPESVYLVGLAQITSTLVTDTRLGTVPHVILSIDLQNVSGTGLSTGATYVSAGRDELIRPLVATDLIQITFPFYPSGPGWLTSARAGLASFSLRFDPMTGALTGGTATVSTPSF